MNCNADDIRQRYDENAQAYDRTIGIVDRLGGVRGLREDFLRRSNGDVLAVAVGTGIDLPFYPAEANVTGIDLSEEMLSIAKEHAEARGKAVDLQRMDAEHMTFPDARFDTVTSTLALCTYPNPVATLKEMARVCKPEGRLLFVEHGKSSSAVIRSMQHLLAPRILRKHGCHLTRDIEDLIAQAGLTIVDQRTKLFGIFHGIEARK